MWRKWSVATDGDAGNAARRPVAPALRRAGRAFLAWHHPLSVVVLAAVARQLHAREQLPFLVTALPAALLFAGQVRMTFATRIPQPEGAGLKIAQAVQRLRGENGDGREDDLREVLFAFALADRIDRRRPRRAA